MGTAENNKAVQRRIIDEVINQKKLDSADELFSKEHVLHPESTGVGRGPKGMKQAFAGLHEEFPDVRVEIDDHTYGRRHSPFAANQDFYFAIQLEVVGVR